METQNLKPVFENLAQVALDLLKGEEYGEVRLVGVHRETLEVSNGSVETLTQTEHAGVAVRVLYRGFWGFAGTDDLSVEGVYRVVQKARELARASATAGGKGIVLSDLEPQRGSYQTPYEKAPFQVPLDEKLGLLLKVDEELRRGKYTVNTSVSMGYARYYQVFASTEGTFVSQEFLETGGGYSVYVVKDGLLQVRSYPASHGGNLRRAGYEFLESQEFVKHAPRILEEAEQLLFAPPAPEGEMDLVIHNSQMVLQVHESVGHALELDRVLGWERGYAGESFATLDKLGSFRYGSPLMHITSDSTVPGGLGTYGWDDEGVPGQRTDLVKEGILVGYLMSRDTAPVVGRRSNGAARAADWSRPPIVRMTNVNLEPGTEPLESLIEGVKDGLFLMTNRSWSIDQQRLNFQFETEIGWRIRNGKLAEVVRNPVYTGITPEFWARMDGLGNDWVLWGLGNCGKGEPPQTMRTGHGTPSARFRRVKVGHSHD